MIGEFKDGEKFRKSFKLIYIGLVFYIFSLDLFDIAGISSAYFFEVIGVVLLAIGSYKLFNASKKFKLSFILCIVTAVVIVGEVTLLKVLNGFDLNNIYNEGQTGIIVQIIQKPAYVEIYYETGVVIIRGLLAAFGLNALLDGSYEYCNRYCNSLLKDCKKVFKNFLLIALIKAGLESFNIVMTIATYNAFNVMCAAAIEQGLTVIPITTGSVSELFTAYVAQVGKYSILGIIYIVYEIFFFVIMIRIILVERKLSMIYPLDSMANTPTDTIDVEAKVVEEEKKDDWQNDFK